MVAKMIGTGIENAVLAVGFKDAKKGKIIVIGGFTVLVAALMFFGVRKIVKRKKAENYGIDDMGNELDDVNVSSGNLSVSEGTAILISQNLLAAMDRIGTDEKSVYSSLGQCNTKDDLLLVIKKFGVKLYDGWGLADTFLSKKIGSTMKNLNGWLRAELSAKELKPVEEIFNKLNVPL